MGGVWGGCGGGVGGCGGGEGGVLKRMIVNKNTEHMSISG